MVWSVQVSKSDRPLSIVRCQYEELFSGFEFNKLSTPKKKKIMKMPFEEAAKALSAVRCQYE